MHILPANLRSDAHHIDNMPVLRYSLSGQTALSWETRYQIYSQVASSHKEGKY
jgi:hypothetical protein